MNKNVLLLGRTPFDMDEVRKNLAVPEVNLYSGINLEEAREVLASEEIDIVIMGAGLDLALRLEIVRLIFSVSDSITVHMKDRSSGRQGMMPFVNRVLAGLLGAG